MQLGHSLRESWTVKFTSLLTLIILMILNTSCYPIQTTPLIPEPTPTSVIPLTDALITFRVTLLEPLPPGDSLYLVTVEEVTGLGLNPQRYIMEAEDGLHYFVILPFVMDSIVEYRYQRQGSSLAQEHLPDGRPVRYRLYHVEGPGIVEDVVSRWTDTQFADLSGELSGQVFDSVTGEPVPSLMIAVGGNQVFTAADGTFSIKRIVPGTHNLITYALDGTYRPFQQGAQIQPGLLTFAKIAVEPAKNITVTFIVSLPENTPPDLPIRLAGNLSQLGNTFADLNGGMSSLADRMPILNNRGDGVYSLSINLPAGTDLRYKYTLGDGLWNAERTQTGAFALRQLIVPEQNITIQDSVDTWEYGSHGNISFETHIPTSDLTNTNVYIQFDPGYGWTEPIPMWGVLTEDDTITWKYTLTSPLDLITELRYRFCLQGDCNVTGFLGTVGSTTSEAKISITDQPQTIVSQVTSWFGMSGKTTTAVIPNVPIASRGDSFIAGVAFQDFFQPSWANKISASVGDINNLHANWAFFSPTWSYSSFTPPTLEYAPKSDPGWDDLTNWIGQAHLLSLKVSLLPLPKIPESPPDLENTTLFETYGRSIWFENYSRMVLHFATLGAKTNVDALIISNKWVMPPGVLQDSQNYSTDTQFWTYLISNIRSIYPGKIFWAITYPDDIASPLSILDLVDGVYVLWSPTFSSDLTVDSRGMKDKLLEIIDRDLAPTVQYNNKPVILAISCPSTSMTEQMNVYNAFMMAINERPWLSGIVSTGYYPLLPMQDASTSINGKPASGVLWYWFPYFLGK